MTITSTDNTNIKLLIKLLADKKYRKQTGLYVIEGERLVCDALKYGAKVQNIFIKNSSAPKYVAYPNAILVADNVFTKISDTVNSQGIVAVVDIPTKPIQKPQGDCLVLDSVRDPGNVGTLIRTAAACNFSDIYLCQSADAYSPKVLRAAMSAHFCVNIYYDCTIEEVFPYLSDCQTVCADMSGQNVFSYTIKNPVALIVGNEGDGLGQYALNNCQTKVSLPMAKGFESLNAAVAGSVIMYMIYGRRP